MLSPEGAGAREPKARDNPCDMVLTVSQLALFPGIGLGSDGAGFQPPAVDKPLNLCELHSLPCEMVRVTHSTTWEAPGTEPGR